MQRLDHLLDIGICKGIPQDFVPLIAEINGILSLRCYHYVSHQTNQEYIVMISHRALIMYDVMNDRYNKPIPLYPYPSKHRNPFMHITYGYIIDEKTNRLLLITHFPSQKEHKIHASLDLDNGKWTQTKTSIMDRLRLYLCVNLFCLLISLLYCLSQNEYDALWFVQCVVWSSIGSMEFVHKYVVDLNSFLASHSMDFSYMVVFEACYNKDMDEFYMYSIDHRPDHRIEYDLRLSRHNNKKILTQNVTKNARLNVHVYEHRMMYIKGNHRLYRFTTNGLIRYCDPDDRKWINNHNQCLLTYTQRIEHALLLFDCLVFTFSWSGITSCMDQILCFDAWLTQKWYVCSKTIPKRYIYQSQRAYYTFCKDKQHYIHLFMINATLNSEHIKWNAFDIIPSELCDAYVKYYTKVIRVYYKACTSSHVCNVDVPSDVLDIIATYYPFFL